jgi:hypothetical protein
MPLLARLDGDKSSAKVWHRSYSCSGIKYCPQIDQQVFLSGHTGIQFDDFNRVDPQFFKFLWRRRRTVYQNLGPKDIFKEMTEQFYLGFIYNWERKIKKESVTAPCTYNGHFTCPYEVPALFTRNGVCFYSSFCIY